MNEQQIRKNLQILAFFCKSGNDLKQQYWTSKGRICSERFLVSFVAGHKATNTNLAMELQCNNACNGRQNVSIASQLHWKLWFAVHDEFHWKR